MFNLPNIAELLAYVDPATCQLGDWQPILVYFMFWIRLNVLYSDSIYDYFDIDMRMPAHSSYYSSDTVYSLTHGVDIGLVVLRIFDIACINDVWKECSWLRPQNEVSCLNRRFGGQRQHRETVLQGQMDHADVGLHFGCRDVVMKKGLLEDQL